MVSHGTHWHRVDPSSGMKKRDMMMLGSTYRYLCSYLRHLYIERILRRVF